MIVGDPEKRCLIFQKTRSAGFEYFQTDLKGLSIRLADSVIE